MNILSDALLTEVTSYLPKPSQAMFAVALTAPSISWSKWSSRRRQSLPSANSRSMAVVSCAQKGWQVLDFGDIKKRLAKKLSDDDLYAILVCINANHCLRTLKLAGCVKIKGHGLKPLLCSSVIEQIDLSFASKHDATWKGPTAISETEVIPILQSIVSIDGNSLKLVQFPYKWRKKCTFNKKSIDSLTMDRFLYTYTLGLAHHGFRCTKCKMGIDGKMWGLNGRQQHVCHDCTNLFCYGCEPDTEIPSLCKCKLCDRDYCVDCVACQWCYSCEEYICQYCVNREGGEFKSCEWCDDNTCMTCLHECTGCQLVACCNCYTFTKCEGCDVEYCNWCFDGNNDEGLETCGICTRTFCSSCRIGDCRVDGKGDC